MTQFINPVEILNLAATDLTNIDESVIKRAKKATLAEIDLSDDGFFDYHGSKLTRADCERVIDELEERDKLEFYHFIANYPALNKFLISGDDNFFNGFRHESIYKLPEFVRFISPYFAAAYDSALWKAWQQYTAPISHITAIEPVIIPDDIEVAYKSVRNDLNRKIEDIRGLYAKVEDMTQEVNLKAIIAQADILLDADRLNMLPPYFDELRNIMVLAVRKLSVQINNIRGDLAIGKQLNVTLQSVKMDSVTQEKVLKDYEVFQQNELQDAENNDPVIQQYNTLIASLTTITKAAANPQSSVSGVRKWVNENIDVGVVDALDEKYQSIKYKMAVKLGALGATIWKHHRDAYAAIGYVEMAEQIRGQDEATSDLLSRLKKEIQEEMAKGGGTPNDPDGSNEKLVRQLVIAAIVIIVIFMLSKGGHH